MKNGSLDIGRGMFTARQGKHEWLQKLGVVQQQFIDNYKNLHQDFTSSQASQARRTMLSENCKSFWKTAKSNVTCFACLQAVPGHVLPCGHAFCEQCVE